MTARAAAARRWSRAAPPLPPRTEPDYQGLVTRSLAFALDAALITVTAVVVGAAVALSLSVISIPSGVKAILIGFGAVASLLWSIVYFVTFWSTTGQTPGNRVLGIRVCRADDRRVLRPTRAFARLVALTLAAIPLLAGFLPILFDDRRRGLHDMLVGTIVVGAGEDEPPPAGPPRAPAAT